MNPRFNLRRGPDHTSWVYKLIIPDTWNRETLHPLLIMTWWLVRMLLKEWWYTKEEEDESDYER